MTWCRHGVNWVSVSLPDKCGWDESTVSADKMGLGRFGRDICDAFPFSFFFLFLFSRIRDVFLISLSYRIIFFLFF